MATALKQADLGDAIVAELSHRTVLTLATTGEGEPHAVSLFYAHDGFDIYWLSDPTTRHSKHLAASPSAAVTIAAQYEDFRDICGLQMQGNARRLGGADEEAAGLNLLIARYPFLEQFATGKLAQNLDAAAVYRFCPARLTLIDNSRGFGFKQTLDLADRSGQSMDRN